MNVGKSHVAATKAKRQLFVIDTELMKDRGVDVMNVYRILNRAHAHLVGRA